MEEPLFPGIDDGPVNFTDQALQVQAFTKEFRDLIRKMLPEHPALLRALEQQDHSVIIENLHNALAEIIHQHASDPNAANKAAAIRILLNRCCGVMNEIPIV
jgi:hypothetical protein